MATGRHSRTLHDVSHLFLSSGASAARREEARAEAVVWIAAAGRSANRAYLAAGAAAAFARQGMFVSVCEIAGNLPNAGYYFGMEPSGYLACALDRAALVAGTWNGSVRFGCSARFASLAGYRGEPLPPAVPHVAIAAFTAPGGTAREPLASLERIMGAFTASPTPSPPDAVVIAGASREGGRMEALAGAIRARYPQAVLVAVGGRAGGQSWEADERLPAPPQSAAASSRRSPPTDPFFTELATILLQRLGSLRRRNARRAANC